MRKQLFKISLLKLIIFYKKNTTNLITRMSLSCIYHPTCSSYMYLCVSRFGPLKGIKLGLNRLCRCRADKFDGGYDPVPKLTIIN